MNWSIRWRTATTYAVLVSVSLLVVGFYFLRFWHGRQAELLQERLGSQAVLAAEAVSVWLAAGDNDMQSLARRLGARMDIRVTIIGPDGQVLGDSEEVPAHGENQGTLKEVRLALTGKRGTAVRFHSGMRADVLYVAEPVTRDGWVKGAVRLSLPLTATAAELAALRTFLVAGGVAAALFAFLAGMGAGKRTAGLLKEMAAAVRRMADGRYDDQVLAGADGELGELGEALNRLGSQLRERAAEMAGVRGRLEAVIDNMVDALLLVNREGRVVLTNPAAEKMLGFRSGQVVGRHHLEATRSHQLSTSIEKVLAGARRSREEFRFIFPQERILEAHLVPIGAGRENAGSAAAGVLVVLRDVTELRRLEKMRVEFVANVSHELRTPLTAIKGFTETLLEGAVEDPEASRRFLRIIEDESERLMRLIDDILDLSRIESGGLEEERVPLDYGGLVEETAGKLRPRAEKQGLTLVTELPGDPVTVSGNRDRLKQVLLNLLDNGINYTPPGGTITVRVYRKGKRVVTAVADTGAGIPAEDLDRIFERFYRVDKARSRKLGGTGLGLAIVKHIVENHGGEVSIRSEEGRGTTVFFTLPAGA